MNNSDYVEAGFYLGRVFTLAEVKLILRHAASLQRLAVQHCNVGLTDAQEKRSHTLRLRIAEICQKHGATPMMHGDPRGACVKILHPKLPNNDWGGEGYCVPTPRY